MIETAARKIKQGPQVREGMIVEDVLSFDYDRKKYGSTVEELCKNAQFTTAVVVQRNRILRTRAKFDEWAWTFVLDTDEELVDKTQLEMWLDIGGRRIGLGDWRPEKSGDYGRFDVEYVKSLDYSGRGAARPGMAGQGQAGLGRAWLPECRLSDAALAQPASPAVW